MGSSTLSARAAGLTQRWLWRAVWLGLALLFCLTQLVLLFWTRALWVEDQQPRQAAPAQGRWVHAQDVDLYVQEFGDAAAPPLLLTHGTGAWSGTWVSNVQAMARAGYRVIAVDLPPFGFSGRPANLDYSRPAQARRILALIDALQLGPVTLLGHSYGGGPAAEAAMLGPQQVRQLILLDAAIGLVDGAQPPPARDGWVASLLDVRALRTALLATVGTQPLFSEYWLSQFVARKEAVTAERTAIYQRPFVLKGFTKSLGDWAYQFALEDGRALSQKPAGFKQLQMPLHLVWGELDTITPLAQAQQLQHLTANATLEVLPGVGHIPQIEDVDLFNNKIAEILRQIAPTK
jgi:pimeloyl-ACP methyl ester carboxylesterase